ncbi:MAG TPA: hypothetical protein VGI61_09430 [Parafilimonas sp.]
MKKAGFVFFVLIFLACNNKPPTNKQTEKLVTLSDTVVHQPDMAFVNSTEKDASATEGEPLIIAGESVGKISLGTDASALQNILGKPDMSDAAMGKAWITWYGKKTDEHNNKTELDIYTAYKDTSMREQTVQQIRTTSSFFITTDSIHVYSSLDEIKNKYAVKKAAQYNNDNRTINIYDDKKNGIAFEIAEAGSQHICTGIIIHAKNKSVNDIYIMLHPDMKRFDK